VIRRIRAEERNTVDDSFYPDRSFPLGQQLSELSNPEKPRQPPSNYGRANLRSRTL